MNQYRLKACGKCSGDLALDDGDWICLQCGTYYYIGLYQGLYRRAGLPHNSGPGFTPLPDFLGSRFRGGPEERLEEEPEKSAPCWEVWATGPGAARSARSTYSTYSTLFAQSTTAGPAESRRLPSCRVVVL